MFRAIATILPVLLLSGAVQTQSSPTPAAASTARPPGTSRTDLQRHDLSVDGWESLQALVTFAPGASFPSHQHPGEEIIYVTEGAIEYEIEGKLVTAQAGEVLFVPYGARHAARNVGDIPAAELATYILEEGKPLVTFTE